MQDAWGWYTAMTQRDGTGKEVREEFRIGNMCTPVVDSYWCMAKPIEYYNQPPIKINKFKLKKYEKEKKKRWCEQQTNLSTPLPLIASLIISQRSSISFLHHSLKFRIYHSHVRETAFPKATSYCRFSKSNGYVFIFYWMNISLLQKQFLTWLLWPPPTGFPFVSLASPYFRSFFFLKAHLLPSGHSKFLKTPT